MPLHGYGVIYPKLYAYTLPISAYLRQAKSGCGIITMVRLLLFERSIFYRIYKLSCALPTYNLAMHSFLRKITSIHKVA
jgi:hypothetical protein